MPLGAPALTPVGYVDFCERKPLDCGADEKTVLAGAQRAAEDRRELMAALGPAMPPLVLPASLVAPTMTQPAQSVGPLLIEDALLPPPAVIDVQIQAAPVTAEVSFVDTAAAARQEQDIRAPRMTPKLWSLLNQVNEQVNSAIRAQPDLASYGRADYWNTPLQDGLRAGDCEDYVLEKERALIAAGVPRQALNIALVTTRWGESHAVLLVATSEGEYVLDNLSPALVTWREAPYHWLRRQVNGEAFNWVMVRNPALAKPHTPMGLLIALGR